MNKSRKEEKAWEVSSAQCELEGPQFYFNSVFLLVSCDLEWRRVSHLFNWRFYFGSK